MYILHKTLAFRLAERLWDLERGLPAWEGGKKREFALFYFARGAFPFFMLLFSRAPVLFLASRSRARKREKSNGAHLCL
jgi:hypothetical protein